MPEAYVPPPLGALTGVQRAAVLLMYLDRPVARKVLQHLSMREVEEIGTAMVHLDAVERPVIEAVVSEFVRDFARMAMVPKSGRAFAFEVLPELVGGARGQRVGGLLRRQYSTEFQEYCASHPPRTLAALLRDEHPQTRAVALLLVGPATAAKILVELSEEERLDASIRMARLEGIPSAVADDVEAAIRQALDEEGADRWQVAGIDRAAQTLGQLARPVNEPILGQISESDPALSDVLRRRMVRFEDLSTMDDRSIQALLRAVERPVLLAALRGADEAQRALFLRNMSSRAADDLREELEIMSPLPRSQVNTAQEEIVQVVLKLAEDGTVQLATGADEMV